MIGSIFLIIFVLSFGGALLMVARKIPVMTALPQNGKSGINIKKHRIVRAVEEKITDFYLKFKKQIFLHKFLSQTKCWILKIEVVVDNLLHVIRRNAQQIEKDLKIKK